MQTAQRTETRERTRTQTPLLQVEDLHIHFKTATGLARVVDGANLTVYRDEIFGIAGESGCGKTTLVEAILHIIRFSNRVATGRVLFTPEAGGETVDLMALSPARMRHFRWEHLSYIPQGSMNSLNPVMRIGAQIADGMTAHGVDVGTARDKVPELLEKVGLEDSVGRLYPHELSGGMKQRAIIATAIAMDPELIIADEPTTALDVNVQRVILDTLLRLRRELGVAILLVSHDLPVHAQLVDRIGIMYAGQVVEIGDVRPVLKNPLHPYTQGLMESIPMIGGERTRLGGIAGVAPSPVEWPTGCRFHPRCPHAMEICTNLIPALGAIAPGPRVVAGAEREIEPARFTACHLYLESTTRSDA
ncbi:MAG: ABC transporter ATP-binding protein [Chloroflexota bacterium]|nr:ABC transporter ATP-binding protein [Chloroflexota bacterium]